MTSVKFFGKKKPPTEDRPFLISLRAFGSSANEDFGAAHAVDVGRLACATGRTFRTDFLIFSRLP
jgi:hypothetical protein